MAALPRGFGRRTLNLETYICRRCLSSAARLHSGHSRWSKIKHDKGKNDAVKNKQRSLLAHELAQASRMFGVDPKSNTRLALAITNAKQAGFPKASIEAAIARGQGVSVSGAKLENLTVEAMFPGAVAFIIEAQAESKAHTLQQIRMVIKDKGGRATTTSHLFEKRGRIVFQKKEGVGADEVLGACLDAEEDVMPEDQFEDEEQKVVVDTKPDQIRAMEEFLVHKLGLEVESSELLWRPNPDTMVSPELEMIQSLAEFEERLTDISGVQGVYTNATAKPDEGDIEEDQKMASAAA